MKQDNELRIFLNKYINIDNNRLEKAKDKVNSEDGSLIKFIQNNLSEYLPFWIFYFLNKTIQVEVLIRVLLNQIQMQNYNLL